MVIGGKTIQDHCNQNKENCYIDIGDLIEITTKEEKNNIYKGEVINSGFHIQNGSIHSCIIIKVLPKIKNEYSDSVMLWIEDIVKIKVLRLGRVGIRVMDFRGDIHDENELRSDYLDYIRFWDPVYHKPSFNEWLAELIREGKCTLID